METNSRPFLPAADAPPCGGVSPIPSGLTVGGSFFGIGGLCEMRLCPALPLAGLFLFDYGGRE